MLVAVIFIVACISIGIHAKVTEHKAKFSLMDITIFIILSSIIVLSGALTFFNLE